MRYLALLVSASLAWPQTSAPIRGFAPAAAQMQHQRESDLQALINARQMREYMDRMAAEPHHAGSAGSKKVAEYALGLFKTWGYEARIEEFDALLPYPTDRLLEMTAPVRYRAKLQEPVLPEDRDSGDRDQLSTYHAYAASGDVTAPVVYVNYGIPEDYEELKKLGVDVKGKIVLARYGRSWRGTKVKMAQENGALACLVYSDPRDDGFYQGDVYPKGGWRPAPGVQRGSVMDMPLYVGDPLTPGWASEKGTRRLTRPEAASLMKIPSLPISYEDAQPLLAGLGGRIAPESWRGGLPVTYHLGPGPSVAHLKVEFDWTSKPMYNVLAVMPGAELADEWVIYGNHHDAWVNGAHDPVSGAASVLEAARIFSELRKKGWRPKRTIMFALWDAEEFGLVGSTEWAEKHAAELKQKVVAYFNTDTNGNGAFGASGTPSLQRFFREVLRDTPHPEKPSVLESMETFKLDAVGAGSDYVVFMHHLGLAGFYPGYGNRGGGVYHSIYDSMHWYSNFSDGDLRYGRSLAAVMGAGVMRLADAGLLPHDFRDLAGAVRMYVDEVLKLKGGADIDLGALHAELERFGRAASDFDDLVRLGRWQKKTARELGEVNRVLRTAEQSLLVESGLPKRPWYKHPITAPGMYTGYGAKTLPWIREALEAGQTVEAQTGVRAVADALGRMRARIGEATRLLAQLPE